MVGYERYIYECTYSNNMLYEVFIYRCDSMHGFEYTVYHPIVLMYLTLYKHAVYILYNFVSFFMIKYVIV